jgi:hypothetical protein
MPSPLEHTRIERQQQPRHFMKSKLSRSVIFALAMTCTASASFAASNSEALNSCLSDNTNGKERKELARWVFFAISNHPDISVFSVATDADKAEADKVVAGLLMRLIGEQCTSQVKATVKSDGPQALVNSFKFLGGLAMQELTTSPAVTNALTGYTKYLDSKKLEAALAPDK